MAATASTDSVHRLLVVAVDSDFYRQVNADLSYGEIDPPRHYDLVGWREGRDPTPWFSTNAYLDTHPDVAARGENPFFHYLSRGWREGREIVASAHSAAYHALSDDERAARKPPSFTKDELAAAAAAFDARYYLATNHDVAGSGVDPLDHFLVHGWRERRDPSHDFSVADYLALNPDVAAGGAHPFLHYVMQGRSEGRATKAHRDFRAAALEHVKPFAERLADSRRWARPVELSAAEALARALAAAERGGLHLTFSQDDYSRSVGGSQLCVQRESASFAAMGRNHLHVHPANGWPTVRSGPTDTPMGVLLNGRSVGVFTPSAIVEALKHARPDGPGSFAIHNMLGHSSRDVADIVHAAGMSRGFFWLHDMGALCAGIHLLRNDIEDCGAPPQGSQACAICVYGPARAVHVEEHRRLFERLEITVAAPSQLALDAWLAGGSLDIQGQVVLAHAHLAETAQPPLPASEEGPLRIAFPGSPTLHKGWPIFRHLAARFADDPRYEFLHLASKPVAGSLARHVPVTVTADRPLAMREAMLANAVDVAMIWSLCLETFSFAAYEAASAGAAVLTGPDSGNVAAFAGQGHGLVLPDEQVLETWFETGEICKLARAARDARIYDLAFSRLTAQLVEQGA
ncbi:hypothetical protein [Phenylobacterium sp.]|uniref:hypothetical protein n=1 Tax=Phenylobacterium sp. TaxID=1871053 RepID=UPI0035AE3B2D